MFPRAQIIEEKRRLGRGLVSPSDFRTREDGRIDPDIILRNADISLYCLDFENREAVFVQTPEGMDLNEAAFLYEWQYQHAKRLYRISFDQVNRLSDAVALNPQSLITIYHVGRCGSTLLSRIFEHTDGVESISEPDVFTQMLAAWGPGGLRSAPNRKLVKSCTALLCVPGTLRGRSRWALKFRLAAVAPTFSACFPQAAVVFLYRHALTWVRSFLRMNGWVEPLANIDLAYLKQTFGQALPAFDGPTTTALDVAAAAWALPMEVCLEMQRRGTRMFVARYEELDEYRSEFIEELLEYCGVPRTDVKDLDAVLARDSQADTWLSRDMLKAVPLSFSDSDAEAFERLIGARVPGLTTGSIVPGTFVPQC